MGKAAQERDQLMAEAAEQARELLRSKEMFFAMVSHEMRTPLTTCIGMAEACTHGRGAFSVLLESCCFAHLSFIYIFAQLDIIFCTSFFIG